MSLGLGSNLSKGNIVTPGIVTDNLVLKHNYAAGAVIPVSDGAAYFAGAGADDYIQVSDTADLDGGTGDLSISFWMKAGSAAYSDKIVDKWTQGGSAGYFILVSSDGKIRPRWDDNSNNVVDTAVTVVADDTWHHVTVVWEHGANHYVYIDGVLDDTVDISSVTGSVANTQPFRIGMNNSTTEDFTGYLCNMGVWNSVLTQAQIKSIMWKNYAGLTDSEKTNLVSWWNLDSTVGTGIGDDATNVFDNHYAGGNALGSNLVANPNFDDETNWTDQNIGASDDVDLSTEQVYIGTNSLKIIGTADHDGSAAILSSGGTVGELYKISARFYVLSGVAELNPGDARFTASTDLERWTSTTNQWEQLVPYGRCISTGTGGALYVSSRGGAATFYVDDVRIEEVQGNPGELK